MFTPAFPRITVICAALLATSFGSAIESKINSQSIWVGEAKASGVSTRTKSRLFVQRKRSINLRNDRVVIQNHLQSQRRSQSVLANPRAVSRSGVVILNGRTGRYNSGVLLRGNRRDRLFVQRQRDIARRNDRLVIENQLQSERRSASVLANRDSGRIGTGVVLGDRAGIISAENDGVAGVVSANGIDCPRGYNCGYRIYSNGTGPRIIVPGVSAGDGLPAFDGVSGPNIITFDD